VGGIGTAPDVGRGEGSARPGGEGKIVIAQLRTHGAPFPSLSFPVGHKRIECHLGQAQRPTRLSVFVSCHPRPVALAVRRLSVSPQTSQGGDPAGAGDDLQDLGQDLVLQLGQRVGHQRGLPGLGSAANNAMTTVPAFGGN
jgi:hypothetical protein